MLKQHRRAKFKQRTEFNTRPYLATLTAVGGGACVGLSFHWLERRSLVPKEGPAGRVRHLKTDETWTRIDAQVEEFHSPKWKRNQDRIGAVAPSINNRWRATQIEIRGDSNFDDLRQKLEAQPGYYAVVLEFEGKGPTHMCALYNEGGPLEFFEPNSGEYKLSMAKAPSFFRDLRTHYAGFIGTDGVRAPKELKNVLLHPIGVGINHT